MIFFGECQNCRIVDHEVHVRFGRFSIVPDETHVECLDAERVKEVFQECVALIRHSSETPNSNRDLKHLAQELFDELQTQVGFRLIFCQH